MSVMRVAAPPAAGSVQMLPWRSTASVRPSGETPTDIDVPSWTVTSIIAGVEAGAPLSAMTKPSTTIATAWRRMAASRVRTAAYSSAGLLQNRHIYFTGHLCRRLAAGDDLDDLLAVKPAVLDEDGAGIDAGDGSAGDEEARHVGFKCLRIVYGRVPLVQRDACVTQ